MNPDSLAFWRSIAEWMAGVAGKATHRPILVGLSAPQGAGKTTLTREVCRMLGERGLHAVSLSIDDFYLTHDEQVALARRSGNRYLRHRGLPGTHDIALGTRTLAALKSLVAGERIRLPAYDRSAFSGQGDRRPEADWPVVDGPLDIAIVEGWMLGFAPVDAATIADGSLREINHNLPAYAPWWQMLDALIWLEPVDHAYVRTWRAEAEAKAIAEGRAGMTPAEVEAFVASYLPCYPLYYPGLRKGSPIDGPYLRVRIGADRLPLVGQP